MSRFILLCSMATVGQSVPPSVDCSVRPTLFFINNLKTHRNKTLKFTDAFLSVWLQIMSSSHWPCVQKTISDKEQRKSSCVFTLHKSQALCDLY